MDSTKSKFHDIELIEYGVVEPNNGRMLSEVDLKINGEVVTERYFSDNWHHIHLYSTYEPDSPDGRFFFVPKEGGGFLLDTFNNFSVIGLPYKALSAASYIGNAYFNGRLFLVYRDEIAVIDLITQKSTVHELPHQRVKWVKPVDAQQFEVCYYETGSWVEKSLSMALE
ncbi:MAG TPA: hypothetical protein VF629_06070 [Hymenobacter sp.]|jgi:hypothetical protein|uniref:hypothetical protein n=1 Tax=Hymenobacter sp. TaxID=1898978 RepID=UPI002ED98C81